MIQTTKKVFSSEATHIFLCFYHPCPTYRFTIHDVLPKRPQSPPSRFHGSLCVYATDNDFQEETVNSGLAYGRCYKITNQNGEVLGHQSGAWHFLQFAQNDQAIFKLCQNLGECTIPNSSYQNLQDHARFWLFDTKGNSFSKDGSFVAANSPPFGGNRRTYPAGGNYKYYVNFWGANQCGSNWLGTCSVKLHVDNLRDDKGLTVTSTKELHVSGAGDTVTVNFAEVSCPNGGL